MHQIDTLKIQLGPSKKLYIVLTASFQRFTIIWWDQTTYDLNSITNDFKSTTRSFEAPVLQTNSTNAIAGALDQFV